MKTQWFLIISLVFALLVAVFAVFNVEPVRVNFLFAEASIPLILVILGCTLLGGMSVASFGAVRHFKLQRKIRALEAEVKRLGDAETKPSPVPVQEETTSLSE